MFSRKAVLRTPTLRDDRSNARVGAADVAARNAGAGKDPHKTLEQIVDLRGCRPNVTQVARISGLGAAHDKTVVPGDRPEGAQVTDAAHDQCVISEIPRPAQHDVAALDPGQFHRLDTEKPGGQGGPWSGGVD